MTTEDSCQCPDHQYRHRVCKHMQAVIEKNAMREAEAKVEELNRFFAGE